MRDWEVDKDRGKAIIFAYWLVTKNFGRSVSGELGGVHSDGTG